MRVVLTAYGQEEDRDKLAALALFTDKSQSGFILELIREKYREVFGQTDPKEIVRSLQQP